MFKFAITRKPGPNFADGLTTATMGKSDFDLMLQQHKGYVDTLRSIGLNVEVLEALPNYPDAYFVEDVAVVTQYNAVITRPGASSRSGEIEHIASTLAKHRELDWIQDPGTLDGGDVMFVENHCYIGISQRTNRTGAQQLGNILEKYGLKWAAIPLSGGLHLKSDVNYIGQNTLLLTSEMAGLDIFDSFERIIIEKDENPAANSLLVNSHLLTPMGFPRISSVLRKRGFDIIELDISEAQKMDGGLSCMSLRF